MTTPRICATLLATLLSLPLTANDAWAQPALQNKYRGERCTGRQCGSYALSLEGNGRFSDSLGRSGTYTKQGRTMRLAFPGGLTTLGQAGGVDCWTDAVPPTNAALGMLNICFAGPGAPEFLANDASSCVAKSSIFALAEENGQWASAALATADDFAVVSVRYQLWTGAFPGVNCHAGIPHRVRVFVGNTTTPAASPVVLDEINVDLVDANQPVNQYATVFRQLPMSVNLDAGEYLFFSIEMIHDAADNAVCVATCYDAPIADRNWWSNAVAAPFPWVQLASFGVSFDLNLDLHAIGHTL